MSSLCHCSIHLYHIVSNLTCKNYAFYINWKKKQIKKQTLYHLKWSNGKPYALGINKSSYFTLFVRQLLTLALPIAIDDHKCPFFMAGLILIIGYLCS